MGLPEEDPFVKLYCDALLLRVPVWGKLHRYRALATFFHALDGLYSAGISPPAAWDAASLTPRNSEVARRLKTVRSRVSPGATVTEMLSEAGIFDMEDIGVASAGEKSGQLPSVLATCRLIYADRALSQKVIGRQCSTGLLVLIFLTVYLGYEITASYIDLAYTCGGYGWKIDMATF